MSHEHRVALEKIAKLCSTSRQPTERIRSIYDIALCALGLTANQREYEMRKMEQSAFEHQQKRLEIRRNKFANREIEK